MAVFAPGDSPPAGGDGGFSAWLQGLAPEAQSAIMRVMAQANPVSPAAADTLSPNPNPLTNPPVDPRLAGGGPPVPPSVLGGGQPPANPLTQPSPVDPRLVGGGPPVTPGMIPPIQASIVGGGGGASGGVGSDARYPVIAADQRGVPQPPGYGPETTHMPYPGQTDPRGVFAPKPPVVVARAPVRAKPVARIPPTARAQAPGSAAGSPFTTIAAQNQDWSGGALSRYPLGGRVGTALDLSKLFGRS